MEAIADALVYLVAYVDFRKGGDDALDDDVEALESVAAMLRGTIEQEKAALAAAVKRALAQEEAGMRRPEFVDCFRNWMESIVGDE